jgi:hypothetical protein
MDSLTSRFNATLKLKEELEARVKFLASEVEQLDPVRKYRRKYRLMDRCLFCSLGG